MQNAQVAIIAPLVDPSFFHRFFYRTIGFVFMQAVIELAMLHYRAHLRKTMADLLPLKIADDTKIADAPGISMIFVLLGAWYSSANVVVCMPFKCCAEIFPVFKFNAGAIALISDDFPTPECPANSTVFASVAITSFIPVMFVWFRLDTVKHGYPIGS